MQKTVRFLRIALPILFVGFVLVIVFSWTRRRTPLDANAGGEPVAITRTGERPQAEAKGFEDTQTNDGVFRRKANDVNFTKDVKLARLADKIDADHVVGQFAQNRKTLVRHAGECHVFMSLGGAAAPGENLGGRKDITCDRFNSEVDP